MRFLIVLYFTVVASVGAVNVWTEDGNEKGAEGSSIRRYLPECEAVAHSSARTCDATAGAAGITGVTCNTGAYETGAAGNDLGCTVCIDQTNCAVSTANTCSTTSTFTTKTICTSVTANGFYLDGQVVKTCATSGNGVRAATVTCTNGNDQIATSCNPGSYLATNACPLCEAVAASSARTCNAGGAAGITGVTCSNGASHQIGTSGDDLGCTLCAGGSFYDGSSCGQCPKGYWLGATSVTTPCKACLAGLYNDQLSQDEVTDCVSVDVKKNVKVEISVYYTTFVYTSCNYYYTTFL